MQARQRAHKHLKELTCTQHTHMHTDIQTQTYIGKHSYVHTRNVHIHALTLSHTYIYFVYKQYFIVSARIMSTNVAPGPLIPSLAPWNTMPP